MAERAKTALRPFSSVNVHSTHGHPLGVQNGKSQKMRMTGRVEDGSGLTEKQETLRPGSTTSLRNNIKERRVSAQKENLGTEPGVSKIPRAKSVTTSSKVKPVPDFSKLHRQWESKISQGKSRKPTSTTFEHNLPATAARPSTSSKSRKPTSTLSEHNPSTTATRPSTSPNGSPLDDPTKVRITSSTAPPPPPPSSVPSTASRTSTNTGLLKTGLQGPARTAVRKPMRKPPVKEEFHNEALSDILNSTDTRDLDSRHTLAPRLGNPKRLTLNPAKRVTRVPVEDEFNNANLADILDSNDAEQLDARTVRRTTGAWGLGNPRRLTVSRGTARRATVAVRHQGADDQTKRASMYAGAIRVARKNPTQTSHLSNESPSPSKDVLLPIPAPEPTADPAPLSLLQKGMDEYFARRNNPPKTPSMVKFVTAPTPREKQQSLARKMGMIVAETFGMTPQRTVTQGVLDIARTPRVANLTLRQKFEAEKGQDDTVIERGMRTLEKLVDDVQNHVGGGYEDERVENGNGVPVDHASSVLGSFSTASHGSEPSVETLQSASSISNHFQNSHVSDTGTYMQQDNRLPPFSAIALPLIPPVQSLMLLPVGQPTVVPLVGPPIRPLIPNPFEVLDMQPPTVGLVRQTHENTELESVHERDTSKTEVGNGFPNPVHNAVCGTQAPAPSIAKELTFSTFTLVQPERLSATDDSWRDVVGITSAPLDSSEGLVANSTSYHDQQASTGEISLPAPTNLEIASVSNVQSTQACSSTQTRDAAIPNAQPENSPRASPPSTAETSRRRRRSSLRRSSVPDVDRIREELNQLELEEAELLRLMEELEDGEEFSDDEGWAED
ncbi:hypothetical protein, variant [Spizellomyces punctatus DAOM BR117]|uniref:Uncharacterized protein n=1 Tax=Spizellomyces punctatus (strain DAOM BR117) TaxID=645134 RepID=A0A0L0HTM2_SPIPD|nr:hypothetical protein, variant [Spizellomyces punctatus DAOM BR117]KND04250.1 hypothetical protein, variant [Spizellomyces punctatus DAOM BR117]|eukprot:XP_016612289.1 hypothetical protein, variant [Spizellomyces punctatus DAOM BR117]